MHCIHLLVGERERANLVVSTADFSLYIIYIYLYISGAGRHHTVMFYVILNTRTNVKFHKSSTKLTSRVRSSVVRLFVMDAAQQSSTHGSLYSEKLPEETCELVRDLADRKPRLH